MTPQLSTRPVVIVTRTPRGLRPSYPMPLYVALVIAAARTRDGETARIEPAARYGW